MHQNLQKRILFCTENIHVKEETICEIEQSDNLQIEYRSVLENNADAAYPHIRKNTTGTFSDFWFFACMQKTLNISHVQRMFSHFHILSESDSLPEFENEKVHFVVIS